jgi:hypothetical protein
MRLSYLTEELNVYKSYERNSLCSHLSHFMIFFLFHPTQALSISISHISTSFFFFLFCIFHESRRRRMWRNKNKKCFIFECSLYSETQVIQFISLHNVSFEWNNEDSSRFTFYLRMKNKVYKKQVDGTS